MLQLDSYFRPIRDFSADSLPLLGSYEPELVALSVFIAVLAAFIALSLSNRVAAARTPGARFAWIAGGGVSMGGGIWSMHFIGMLAFGLPCAIAYDPWVTLLSMLPGVLASAVALVVIADPRGFSWLRLLLGAVLMGGGIGAMHYTGMAAMRLDALLRYDIPLVALSVGVAVLLAFIALGVRFLLQLQPLLATYSTPLAAAIMGCAVPGMHYTAMAAARFYPTAAPTQITAALEPTTMALLIAAFTFCVAAIALAAGFAGRQFETAIRLAAEIERRGGLERELRADRTRLQAIFDGANDGIVTANAQGQVQHWSRGAERIFGYSAEEARELNVATLLPGLASSDFGKQLRRRARGELAQLTATEYETEALCKDGALVPVELSVSEASIDGELLLTGILRDITERRRAQQELETARQGAEAANQAKSMFLANMSHEIRTPLNAVIGMAHLLLKTELGPRQRDYVRKIQQSGRHLLGIVNDVLDFSKIEADQLVLERVEFDLEGVLVGVSDVVAERANAKGLELIFDLPSDLPTDLVGDPLRLGQVLINYATNAVKFTEAGEVVIQVRQEVVDGDSVRLRFTVRDTGIGIAEDELPRLFQSFQQADASTTRRYGGTGLGLAISRRLAEMMGGSAGVSSQLGQGSEFWFTAWLGKGRNQPGQRHAEPALNGRTALLVDDNASARATIADMLEAMQFRVVQAASGAEALRLAETESYDIAFVDWRMPEMDGLETVRRLRATRPQAAGVAHVLVTAYGREDVLRQAEAAGLDDILVKPVNGSLLFDCAVRMLLGSAPQHDAAPFSELSPDQSGLLRGRRVLLVEDNELNRDVACDLLRAVGIQVAAAHDGREALHRLDHEQYDLVLMDMQMPVMDGLAATRAIRAQSQFAALPIIAMTANAMAQDRAACLAAGMNDHLAKPINPDLLYDTLARWLAPAASLAMPQSTPITVPAIFAPLALLLDVPAGLRRVLNQQDRYLAMLGKYAAGQRQVIQRVQAALAVEDCTAAEREAHTARGLAGNIGAEAVAAAAARLEAAIKQGCPGAALADELEQLDAALQHVLDAIDALLVRMLPAETAQAAQAAPLENAALQRLQTLLADDDPAARDFFDDHAAALGARFGASAQAGLAAALGDYDLPAAAQLLAQAVAAETT
ncbi:response regulator [Ferrovibrio sp.]|uniref:response regulator n=1 Tax=Ferrovibrio sp. TaxID=1917215 RepID=UPI001B4B7B1C|nr:response regulator [Ferrovibrio sp.]MBP7062884.1 response regulator [Ferrovibrio sp.]